MQCRRRPACTAMCRWCPPDCCCLRRAFWDIGGKKVGIHPARVRKLMVSTNVCGRKLAATDYKFHYTLEESFRDWFEDCDRKELV